MKSDKPAQIENLLEKIREFIKSGKYRFSVHAIKRRALRAISVQDAIYVLTHGYDEKRKTSFDEAYRTWKYAIRERTVDGIDIIVVIAVIDKLIVITVINVTREKL